MINLGTGETWIEDFSTLRYVHRLNREERGCGATIDIVPALDDPKNLFALLAAKAPPLRATA